MSKVYMSKLNFYLSRTIGDRFWCTLNLLLRIVMMIIMIIINDASGQSVLRKRNLEPSLVKCFNLISFRCIFKRERNLQPQ